MHLSMDLPAHTCHTCFSYHCLTDVMFIRWGTGESMAMCILYCIYHYQYSALLQLSASLSVSYQLWFSVTTDFVIHGDMHDLTLTWLKLLHILNVTHRYFQFSYLTIFWYSLPSILRAHNKFAAGLKWLFKKS